MAHRIIGAFLLLAPLVQAPLGINILYPWIEPREIHMWAVYFLLSGFWIAAFMMAEFYYLKRVYRKDIVGSSNISSILSKSSEASILKSGDTFKPMKTFTWKTLDEAIQAGNKYVVADGQYVYDISKWIASHPGGRIILNYACGTDISNDYFHESGTYIYLIVRF
jgi:predicted heme/steroid binding protein